MGLLFRANAPPLHMRASTRLEKYSRDDKFFQLAYFPTRMKGAQ